MGTARRRATRIALGAAGGIVAVLGLAQLLLPGLAAQRVRDELGRYGVVRSATVSALPAIELLWGHAQSANVDAGGLTMSASQLSSLLWKARGVQRLDLRAASLRVGPLTLRHVTSAKRGDVLYATGSLAEAALRAAIPGSTGVQLLESTPDGVLLRVSGTLFGVGGSVDVLLSTLQGRLVAQPQGIPFAGLLRLTVLSAPHLYVQTFALASSASAPSAGGAPPGAGAGAGGEAGGEPAFLVNLTAQLR
jgi:hypothetical protein